MEGSAPVSGSVGRKAGEWGAARKDGVDARKKIPFETTFAGDGKARWAASGR